MEIRLHRIGMIEDSEIKLDGLTVVTGENNSGKTTIGKALYALVDAVSDLPKKAEEDKDAYILNALMELAEYGVFRSTWLDNSSMYEEYPALFALLSYAFDRDYSNDIPTPKTFAHQVEEELKSMLRSLDADEETEAFNETLHAFVNYYSRMVNLINFGNRRTNAASKRGSAAKQRLRELIANILETLQACFDTINGDPLFTSYVKDSVNSMLREEFSKQIQPVRDEDTPSGISLTEDDLPFLEIKLRKNSVTESAFHELPMKKAFFVDNPIVLDYNFVQLILSYRKYASGDIEPGSYFNPRRTRSHMARLSAILRGGEELNPIEQRGLDEKLAPVKAKINAVVPGTFDFSGADEFYVLEGDRLRLTNLAAGSKMFSIVKLLMEKGLLNENSLLILDEPEIHLHPKWQNQLAEVIVLLVEELGVRALLTTHSFEFMLALETWAKKYQLRDRANFYLSRRLENGRVTHERKTENLGAIYDELVEPTEEMDALRDALDDDENPESAEGGDGKE